MKGLRLEIGDNYDALLNSKINRFKRVVHMLRCTTQNNSLYLKLENGLIKQLIIHLKRLDVISGGTKGRRPLPLYLSEAPKGGVLGGFPQSRRRRKFLKF